MVKYQGVNNYPLIIMTRFSDDPSRLLPSNRTRLPVPHQQIYFESFLIIPNYFSRNNYHCKLIIPWIIFWGSNHSHYSFNHSRLFPFNGFHIPIKSATDCQFSAVVWCTSYVLNCPNGVQAAPTVGPTQHGNQEQLQIISFDYSKFFLGLFSIIPNYSYPPNWSRSYGHSLGNQLPQARARPLPFIISHWSANSGQAMERELGVSLSMPVCRTLSCNSE